MMRRKPTRSDVAPSTMAIVTREFAATRVERQVIAQVFELVWRNSETNTVRSLDDRELDFRSASTAARSRAGHCNSVQGGDR